MNNDYLRVNSKERDDEITEASFTSKKSEPRSVKDEEQKMTLFSLLKRTRLERSEDEKYTHYAARFGIVFGRSVFRGNGKLFHCRVNSGYLHRRYSVTFMFNRLFLRVERNEKRRNIRNRHRNFNRSIVLFNNYAH